MTFCAAPTVGGVLAIEIAPLADVKARLSAHVDQVVPTDDEDLGRLVLARSPRFQTLLERCRRSIRAGAELSSEDFWKRVEDSES